MGAARNFSTAEDGQIEIYAGRYGPYVQHGKIRATLPKSVEPEALTLEEALDLFKLPMSLGEYENKEVIVVYDKQRKTLASFLPIEAKHEDTFMGNFRWKDEEDVEI